MSSRSCVDGAVTSGIAGIQTAYRGVSRWLARALMDSSASLFKDERGKPLFCDAVDETVAGHTRYPVGRFGDFKAFCLRTRLPLSAGGLVLFD
jgi:hypothetical protein